MHNNTQSLSWCRTLWLFTEGHANWTIGARCKHGAPADLTVQSKQPASFELLKKHLFEWRRVVIASLCSCWPHSHKKQALVCRRHWLTNWGNVRRRRVGDLCYWWRDTTKPVSLIPLSIKRRWTKQNTLSQSYTFHTFSTHSNSSVGQSGSHTATVAGPKPHDWPHVHLHIPGFVN